MIRHFHHFSGSALRTAAHRTVVLGLFRAAVFLSLILLRNCLFFVLCFFRCICHLCYFVCSVLCFFHSAFLCLSEALPAEFLLSTAGADFLRSFHRNTQFPHLMLFIPHAPSSPDSSYTVSPATSAASDTSFQVGIPDIYSRSARSVSGSDSPFPASRNTMRSASPS